MGGAHENGDTTVGHSCGATPHKHPVNSRAVRSAHATKVSPPPSHTPIYINPSSPPTPPPLSSFNTLQLIKLICSYIPLEFQIQSKASMESMKMKLFAAVVVMLMAVSAVSNVAAQEAPAPAPGPSSAASVYVPAALISLISLSFGLLF